MLFDDDVLPETRPFASWPAWKGVVAWHRGHNTATVFRQTPASPAFLNRRVPAAASELLPLRGGAARVS